jgi:hypothetical protein
VGGCSAVERLAGLWWSLIYFEREAVDGLAFEVFSNGETKTVYRLSFQILIGVEVLAGGFDVRMAEEFLDRDDVGAALQEPRCVRVAEFVEGSVFDFCLCCDWLMRLPLALGKIHSDFFGSLVPM